MKRSISMLLAALACGIAFSQAQAAEKKYTIGTVVKIDGIAWFDRMREGVVKFAKDTGHDAFLLGPAKADAAEQVKIIEGLIAQQVDAICVVPFSPEALEPVLKKARDAGIVVISHEATNQENVDYDIEAFVNEDYGAHMMDNLAKFMNGEGEYTNFVGSLTSKSHNQWMDGAEARQKEKYPNLKLVSPRNEDYDDQNKAYQKSKELLTTYPKLKGILGSASTTAPGAGLAVEEAQLQDKVAVVGTSLVSSAGQYLKSGGTKMIFFWDPADAGYVMNKMAVMLLEKKAITNGMDLGVKGYEKITVDPKNPKVFFGAAWVDVTKENMGDYNF
ncbi:MAG: autoinducer 2 ABC transporter substrate-binding protein [Propionivibrio sp.]